MLDLLTISLFLFFLFTVPDPVLFVISAVLIWMSLNWTMFMVFRLPHRKRRIR